MQRDQSLGYVVNHVARLMAGALHARIAPQGVVPGQFAQLLALYERDGVTQQELCEIVQVEQPTMANTLARMERDGLIMRQPHPDDGRKQLIHLTKKARFLEATLIESALEVNANATVGFSQTERAALMDLLARVRTNLTGPD